MTQIHNITIKPNNSLPPALLKQTIVIISLPSLFLAIALASMGFWLILPFALAQLLALAFAFQSYKNRSTWREIISISGDQVILERGHGKCEERIELPRHWSSVSLQPPEDLLKPNRLLLRASKQAYEVASCLTDSARFGLKARLHHLIGPVCCTPNI